MTHFGETPVCEIFNSIILFQNIGFQLEKLTKLKKATFFKKFTFIFQMSEK